MSIVNVSNRPNAQYIFVSRMDKHTTVYDIGIVTDTFRYLEFEIQFQTKAISRSNIIKLNQIFSSVKINLTTDVCLFNIDWNAAIRMYLFILTHQLGFRMHDVELHNICRRILAYHGVTRNKKKKDSQVGKLSLIPTFEYMTKNGKCPWITKASAMGLHLKSESYKRRKMIVRLGAYYMFAKAYLIAKSAASYQRKQEKLKLVQAEQLSAEMSLS